MTMKARRTTLTEYPLRKTTKFDEQYYQSLPELQKLQYISDFLNDLPLDGNPQIWDTSNLEKQWPYQNNDYQVPLVDPQDPPPRFRDPCDGPPPTNLRNAPRPDSMLIWSIDEDRREEDYIEDEIGKYSWFKRGENPNDF